MQSVYQWLKQLWKDYMQKINGYYLTEDQHDEYQERAAIMEFDGKLSREYAEKKALERIVEKYNLKK